MVRETTTTNNNNNNSDSSSSLSSLSSPLSSYTMPTLPNKSNNNNGRMSTITRLPALSTSPSQSTPQLATSSDFDNTIAKNKPRRHERSGHHNKTMKTASGSSVVASKKTNSSGDGTVIDKTNLYKHSPTIVFVKEKYKVYLDWLAHNYASLQQQQSSSSQHHVQHHHLAWYDFEKSLDKSTTTQHSTTNNSTSFHDNHVNQTQQQQQHHYLSAHHQPNHHFVHAGNHQTMDSLDSSVVAHNQRLLAAVLGTLRNSREFTVVDERRLDLDSIRRGSPTVRVFFFFLFYFLIYF